MERVRVWQDHIVYSTAKKMPPLPPGIRWFPEGSFTAPPPPDDTAGIVEGDEGGTGLAGAGRGPIELQPLHRTQLRTQTPTPDSVYQSQ